MCLPLCTPRPYVEFYLKDPPKDKKKEDKKNGDKKDEDDRYIVLRDGAQFYRESTLFVHTF